MDLSELLSKLKLVDFSFDPKVQGEQVGMVNIKNQYDNKNYNVNVYLANPETAKAFAEAFGKGLRTEELEIKAKQAAKQKLEPIRPIIDVLSDSTKEEFIAKTIGLSAIEAVKTTDSVAVMLETTEISED